MNDGLKPSWLLGFTKSKTNLYPLLYPRFAFDTPYFGALLQQSKPSIFLTIRLSFFGYGVIDCATVCVRVLNVLIKCEKFPCLRQVPSMPFEFMGFFPCMAYRVVSSLAMCQTLPPPFSISRVCAKMEPAVSLIRSARLFARPGKLAGVNKR